MFDVIVIGGGLAGTLSALNLSSNCSVLLIEAGDEIIPTISSSYNECYKLHTGLHYAKDVATAEHCLDKSIEFAREFPNMIAGSNDLSAPWRRGRHYFMSNSMVSMNEAINVAFRLKERYRQLVDKDARNEVFGPPAQFVRFLSPDECPEVAKQIPFHDVKENMSMINVSLGIDSAESQIDIARLRAYLQEEITKRPNITFLPASFVTSIAPDPTRFGYTVTVKNKNNITATYDTTSVINCAWQNIEKLDSKLGMYVPDEHRVSRIKASILVTLPKAMQHIHTSTFSCGPYCSMTVLPNGTAILASERTTNVTYVKSGLDSYPEDIQDLINNKLKLNHPYGKNIAKTILDECAVYFNDELAQALREAPINELHVGFVKLINLPKEYTDKSIHEADSVVHARQDDGVEVRDIGYISNSGMKMTYTVGNAIRVVDELKQHAVILNSMNNLVHRVMKLLTPLPESIQSQEKNISQLLHVTYKDHIRQLVCSEGYELNTCAEQLRNEIIETLEIREVAINQAVPFYRMISTLACGPNLDGTRLLSLARNCLEILTQKGNDNVSKNQRTAVSPGRNRVSLYGRNMEAKSKINPGSSPPGADLILDRSEFGPW